MNPVALAQRSPERIATQLGFTVDTVPDEFQVRLCNCPSSTPLRVTQALAMRAWEIGAQPALFERGDFRAKAIYALIAACKVLAAAGRIPGEVDRHTGHTKEVVGADS